MSDTPYDFAVFGATPLAQLLAGLLASVHGRRVVLVGEGQAGYRLVRGIDLSVAPITRPESWAMLTQALPEVTRLVSRIGGRGALSRVNPIFFAEGWHHAMALSHVQHMAQGFGIAVEPVSQSLLGEGRQGIMLRDAVRINRPALEAGLGKWLERAGVTRLQAQKVSIASDGQAEIIAEGAAVVAKQTVLADDDAVMAWLPLRQWPALLRRQHLTSILTTPTQPLAAGIMLQFNSGIVLTQQAEGGIAAFGPGGLSDFADAVQALLGQNRPVELAGQTGFQALQSLDGAPAFGRVAGVGADVAAALGCAGAFLAPAYARWLASSASPEEAAWFGAHLVNRSAKSQPVAEYAPGHGWVTA
ncbi:hypothetical protein [Devosia sediminis]|uniref:FAD dependent oxidoreductase domain-containing protein n=1 Tax=Devosia sediminis TaxID=2798801 RepID=A0A934MKI2_9HYPH|nr:hypothetical protein [Devosia sediminis]MBJ3785178.1 hypothetical protein [Devosia sediminis]